MKLARRTLLEGLGCAVVAACAPVKALASLAPVPDLEALFGPRRIEVVKEVWRAGEAGELEPGGRLDLGWGYVRLDELLDADDRFRVSPAMRHGLARFMSGCPAVEIEHSHDEGCTMSHVNIYTAGLAVDFGLFPPATRADLEFGPGNLFRRRFWTGDAGEALGWHDWTQGDGWGRPRPELMRLV